MTTLMPSDREAARARLMRQRKVKADVMAYIVINAFLIGIWAVGDFGSFWPGWVLAGWGVFLVLDAWDAYFRHDVTESDVQRELDKRR